LQGLAPQKSPVPHSPITIPMVLHLLDKITMATHRGIDMVRPKEGSYGFILKIFGQNGSKIAVKLFKRTVDTELAFLGVDYDPKNMAHVLNMTRRNKYQKILYDSGFVPTVLRQADPTCPVCRCVALREKERSHDEESIGYRANKLLTRKIHYHVYMPLMDGNLHDLLRQTVFSVRKRMKIFMKIAEVIDKLSQHGIINPDLKAPNILHRKTSGKYIYAPCDVGGLYVAHQGRIDLELDEFKRHLVTTSPPPPPPPPLGEQTHLARSNRSNRLNRLNRLNRPARRLIGQSCAEDDTKYASPLPTDEVAEVRWTVATYVNIFLDVQGVKSNYDLSDATHLTNQFSLLAFFMYMVHITPPSHELATNEEVFANTKSRYPTIDSYLEDHTSVRLSSNTLHKPITHMIKRLWTKCSNWELCGTKHTYVRNIMDEVQALLDIAEHTPPPRKVLRHTKFDP
jgi:hypothetical protein